MLNILIIVAAFLIAVVLARIIIPRILIISLRKRLFDTPDARKVHKRPVSRLGGVSFFPAILFTVTFLIGICYMTGWVSLVDTGQHWVQILFMCTGLTLLYIVGITDDLIGVRYRQKFLVQLIAASMFPLAGLYINDFYGLFGIHAVSPFIGVPLTLGYILSFLAVQYTMNTYEAGINYEGAILISFSVLLVPCLDVVRVVLGRVRRGKDPFMPDKTHIHHKFLAMGFTPRKAMISILCISFLFCASNVFLVSYLNNTVLFLCDVAVWALMNLYISKLISRRNISQI